MKIFQTVINRSIDQEKLESVLELPRNYLGEDVVAIIPSLKMTNEGPVLTKLLVFTKTFLCEVNVGGPDEFSFDLIDRTLVVNIRVDTGISKVNVGDDIVAIYKTAQFKIIHASNMTTTIEFVGEERDEWIAAVQEMLPANICKLRR